MDKSKNSKLPKVVKTRETLKASENPDRSGECDPMNMGRPGVFVETPEDWPDPGSEMMHRGQRVTVDGTPTPTGKVWVYADRGAFFSVDPSDLTLIPKTRTVTYEIPADEDPKTIGIHRRGWYTHPEALVEAKLIAIDGEETDQ